MSTSRHNGFRHVRRMTRIAAALAAGVTALIAGGFAVAGRHSASADTTAAKAAVKATNTAATTTTTTTTSSLGVSQAPTASSASPVATSGGS
jgi:hypothetical protein